MRNTNMTIRNRFKWYFFKRKMGTPGWTLGSFLNVQLFSSPIQHSPETVLLNTNTLRRKCSMAGQVSLDKARKIL